MMGSLAERILMKQRWFLAVRPFRDPFTTDGYTVIYPPRDRFYADPFLVRYKETSYLFFEDYRYRLARGVISCAPLDSDGTPVCSDLALDPGHHVSYPFVFEWHGDFWLVPETSRTRDVRLYRCRSFPDSWALETTLLRDRTCADTTLFCQNDQWWMFTSELLDSSNPHAALCVYSAAAPTGPWRSHRNNPVVFDAACARPAGSLFMHCGELLRPAQDCSRWYGGAIRFARIEVLTEEAYVESPAGRIEAGWFPGLSGTHTYNSDGAFEAIDGCILRFDPYGKWLSAAAALRSAVGMREEAWIQD